MAYSSMYCDAGSDSSIRYSSENLLHSTTTNTPIASTNVTSRKRKVAETITSGQLMRQTSDSFDSSAMFGKYGPVFLSSTMNESITNELERCNLDSFASSDYVERSDITDTPAATTQSQKMSCRTRAKEPSTPMKTKSYLFSSSNGASPMQKLGSPERNEILYPNLHRTGSGRQVFNDASRRFSPAKKRLFKSADKLKDPIQPFWNSKKKVPKVVEEILLNLCDEDLYACSRVNKNWKDAITKIIKLNRRLQSYTERKVMNKENYVAARRYESSPIEDYSYWSPFKEIESPVTRSIYEITNLTEGQHLEKCRGCFESSAIVEGNISQCNRRLCGYIRCLKCDSTSTEGPDKFVDKCQNSSLLTNKPKSRFSLMSSPPRGVLNESGIPSFFLDDTQSPTLNTSGYVTDLETSLSHSGRLSSGSFAKGKTRVLQNCNANFTTKRGSIDRYNQVVPVVPLNNVKKAIETIEPSSPPKVRDVACSKKSRRNLKRLKF